MLDENPLPAVVVITPRDGDPARVEALRAELARAEGVEAVELDARWLARLQAMLELSKRAVALLAALFALAVVVIVGNTIRLDIQNRRQEIEVAKLIGATDGWIRRPFLYEGAWYGAAGGLAALALIGIALGLLSGPVAQLAGLYGSERGLVGLDLGSAGAVVLGGALLGWAGSWLAVARHLAEIEPT
jgi:cell division transport system permease protein